MKIRLPWLRGLTNLQQGGDTSYKDSFEEVAIGLAHVNFEGKFIRVNKSLCHFLGYAEKELLQTTFQQLTLKEELGDSINFIQGALAGEITESFSKVKRYRHKNGQLLWAKLTTTLIKDANQKPSYFLSSIQDISELKQTEHLLKQSEQKLKLIIESIASEVAVWLSNDKHSELLYVNQGFSELWGLDQFNLSSDVEDYFSFVHDQDVQTLRDIFANDSVNNFELDYRIVDSQGQIRHVHHVGRSIKEDDNVLYFVSSIIDRTALIERQILLDDSLLRLKVAYRDLQEFSRRDGLTGALNSTAFKERLAIAFEQYQRHQSPATLVFIDIDRFKQVNDTWGHLAGDQALIELVNHLNAQVRLTDAVGRFGGDEFLVLLTENNSQQAVEFCRRVGTGFTITLESGEPVEIRVSIGLRALTTDITSVDRWMRLADTAMYGQKN